MMKSKVKNGLISIAVCLLVSGCYKTQQTTITPAPTLKTANAILDADTEVEITNDEENLVTIYKNVNPGVVSINTYKDSVSIGNGSGFVIDNDGYILTNYHVVEYATEMEIIFSSGYHTMATLVGTDPDSDIAVVKVEVPGDVLVPLQLGDSSETNVGQSVVAIGNPYMYSGTMTVGIVSAKGRMQPSMRESPSGKFFSSADLIQTDAAINPGNSGGPLINLAGEVIGINRAIQTNGNGNTGILSNSGIGFAVPIDIVKQVVPFLIRDGVYNYPYLGITSTVDLTLAERKALNLPPELMGAYVTNVISGGPADQAGMIGGSGQTGFPDLLAGGDFITEIDGQPIRNFSDLLSYLVTNKIPGDDLSLTILRDGEEIQLTVTLELRPN